MPLLDVYNKWPLSITSAKGSRVFDSAGQTYLDMYGGHAVISIGHGHHHYVQKLKEQLDQIAFYSNAVEIPGQQEAAMIMRRTSSYDEYKVFFCNSGAEANENALKIASFATRKKKIICFDQAFHGRTSLAAACTDMKDATAPVNESDNVIRIPTGDAAVVEERLRKNDVAAILFETISGVGGCHQLSQEFLLDLKVLAKRHDCLLIADEIQSGTKQTSSLFVAFKSLSVSGDSWIGYLVPPGRD